MITTKDCFAKYGEPTPTNKWMMVWDVPVELEHGFIPKKIYCNKDMVEPLGKAFRSLIDTGCVEELRTWDGCFNVRVVRGYELLYKTYKESGNVSKANELMSIHSWAVAIDVNAYENGLGKEPKLSEEFVKCFKGAGFDWGGDFSRKDGMHFQLAKI